MFSTGTYSQLTSRLLNSGLNTLLPILLIVYTQRERLRSLQEDLQYHTLYYIPQYIVLFDIITTKSLVAAATVAADPHPLSRVLLAY